MNCQHGADGSQPTCSCRPVKTSHGSEVRPILSLNNQIRESPGYGRPCVAGLASTPASVLRTHVAAVWLLTCRRLHNFRRGCHLLGPCPNRHCSSCREQHPDVTIMYPARGLGLAQAPNRYLFAASELSDKDLTNSSRSSARHDRRDDLHDQFGSNSPTPSGVETPRPDLHDKRLPGIMHSYFGQVGRDPSQRTPSRSSQAATNPEVNEELAHSSLKSSEENEARRASSASLGSMVMVEREQESVPPTPPDELHQRPMQRVTEPDASRMPPTPISSAASVVHRDGDAAENGASMLDGGIASITQALRNFVLPKTAFGMKERRHQSLPVSSVTKSNVSAAHISNPTSSTHSSRPHSPKPSSPSSAKPPSSQNLQETDELTSDVAAGPREKRTPPQTPRALSQEDRRTDVRSPLSSTSTSSSTTAAAPAAAPPAAVAVPVGDSEKQLPKDQLPTTSTPRGKLSIKIAEGRNLKPSYDPYVICQFEWNEYVSQGPRHDRMDVDDDDRKGPVAALQSVPIRRTDSDMGKPMAIPMRSRQSSTNGSGEDRGLSKVSDPQWDHEATL